MGKSNKIKNIQDQKENEWETFFLKSLQKFGFFIALFIRTIDKPWEFTWDNKTVNKRKEYRVFKKKLSSHFSNNFLRSEPFGLIFWGS